MTINEILSFLRSKGINPAYRGPADLMILKVEGWGSIRKNTASWLHDIGDKKKFKSRLEEVKRFPPFLLITTIEIAAQLTPRHNVLIVDCNPRYVAMLLKTIIEEAYSTIEIEEGDVKIHQTAVIGTEGLSPNLVNGVLRNTPHTGGIHICKNVSIGAHCVISKGLIDNTYIGEGCMLGHHSTVGHAAHLARNVVLAPHASIGGSTFIEEGAWIGMGAMIKQGLKIGENAFVGMGAVVIHDVPSNAIVAGNPAREIDAVRPW